MPVTEQLSAAETLSFPAATDHIERPHRHSHAVESYPCPRCACFAVQRSRLGSNLDALLKLLFVAPYRCHRCYLRFRRFVPAMLFSKGSR